MLSTRSIDTDYLTMREAEVQSLRRMLSVLSADLAEASAKAAALESERSMWQSLAGYYDEKVGDQSPSARQGGK